MVEEKNDTAPVTETPGDGGQRFPEMEEIRSEIEKRLRDNRRFLERFLEEDFEDDEEGSPESEDFEEL